MVHKLKSIKCTICEIQYQVPEEISEKEAWIRVELDGNLGIWCTRCCKKLQRPTPWDIYQSSLIFGELPKEEKIYITPSDYNKYKFCRNNWVCNLMYKVFGK